MSETTIEQGTDEAPAVESEEVHVHEIYLIGATITDGTRFFIGACECGHNERSSDRQWPVAPEDVKLRARRVRP